MAVTFVVTTACVGCGACLLTCPEHAIAPWGDPRTGGPLTVLDDRCTGCSACAEVCPEDACLELSRLAGAPAAELQDQRQLRAPRVHGIAVRSETQPPTLSPTLSRASAVAGGVA